MMSLEPAIDAAIAKALAAGSGSFSSFSTGPIEFSGSNGNTNFEGSYESSSLSSSFEGSSGNAAGNAAGQLLGNEDMTNNGWAAAGIAQQKPSGATAFHAGAMNQVRHCCPPVCYQSVIKGWIIQVHQCWSDGSCAP